MKKIKITRPYIILTALTFLLVCLPVIPTNEFFPSRDAGVFLYIGDLIRDGKIPYRDAWDHKGPLIFLIYAIGLEIGSGTIWGPWILESSNAIACTLLCYKILQEKYSKNIALASASMMTFAIVPTGLEFNLTEAYALPFQILAILSFDKLINKPKNHLWPSIIGASCAATLLLKPNLIGAWVCIFVYLSIIKFKERSKINEPKLIIATLSGLVIIALATIYLWTNSALHDAYIAVWQFNREYANAEINQRLNAAWHLMKASSKSGFSTFATFGLIVAVLQ